MGAEGRIFRSLKKFLPDASFTGTQIHGYFHSLEDLLGKLLGTIKQRAEKHLQQTLDTALLGHPALFSQTPQLHQKALQRLEKSAKLAGFKRIEFCPEPVAAAHQFVTQMNKAQTVLIADFGGGTSDFTLVRMRPDGFAAEDVLALGGLSLAGDAFDGSIMEHLIAPLFGSKISYKMPYSKNVLTLPKALIRKMCSPADLLLLGHKDYLEFFRKLDNWSEQEDDYLKLERLRMLVEEREGYHLFQCIEDGKKALGTEDVTAVVYEYPSISINQPLIKAEFQTFTASLVASIIETVDATVHNSGLRYEDIDLVCCTGGTARLDAIQLALASRIPQHKLQQHLPFHAVIRGLAERAVQMLRA